MVGWLQLAFALSVLVAAATLAGALLRLGSRQVLVAASVLLGVTAVGSWVAFATDPSRSAGIAATGTSACFLVSLAALSVRRVNVRLAALDTETQRVRAAVRAAVEEELQLRTAELERALTLSRAESISRLAEEERRIAEERRHAVSEREQEASRKLSEALIEVERRVDQRVAAWVGDLERGEARLAEELEKLTGRQKELVTQAQSRLATDLERLESVREEQRAQVAQLRSELEKLAQEAVQQARAELDTNAAERRRALHEVSERLRARERALQDLIEREEAEAVRRIQAGLGEIERRQLEQLKRIVDRTANSVAEAAAAQFDGTIKSAREEAARRLGRELERAVDSFLRQAHTLLEEQVTKATDEAGKRIEERGRQVLAAVERRAAARTGED